MIRACFLPYAMCLLFAGIVAAGCGCREKRTVVEDSGLIIALSDSSIRTNRADTILLGRMRAGETVVKNFTLRNDSTEPLIILQVETNCNCTAIEYPRMPLMPGESGRCGLTFDASGLAGWVVKYIYLHTSVNGGAVYKIVLEAEVE